MPRPQKTFHDFVGQPRTVPFVSRIIDGAKVKGKPAPSLLLAAPSGYGKTDFASAVAAAMGTELYPLFAGRDVTPEQVCAELYKLSFGDILFIDEAHSLRDDAQQILFLALDSCKIPMPGERGLNRSEFVSIAPHTLLIATNQPGNIKDGLRKRLTHIEFDRYSIDELREIAERIARLLNLTLTGQAKTRIAKAAQGVPRYIKRRLELLELHFPTLTHFHQSHVDELLAAEGIDAHGLGPFQRDYLTHLADSATGGCTLVRLAACLGMHAPYICQEVEPFLFHTGLVAVTGAHGRTLTTDGRALVAELRAEAATHEDEEVGV